jgi:hypothetical protein
MPGLTVSVNLNVPALPDNDVAFINNAAWQNYWSNVDLTATFTPAVAAPYAEFPFDTTLLPVTIQQEGQAAIDVPSYAQFYSLLISFTALNAEYKALKATLTTLGLIQ